MKLLSIKTGLLIVLFLPIVLWAQEKSDSVRTKIQTKDGNEFIGVIVGSDSLTTILKTENLGVLTIKQSDIKTIENINDASVKEGKLWFPNPQATRYFWSPNGYGLKKGEGYYHNIWVLWNQVAYGITNNFSIGGGIIPTFFFGGSPTPVFITPKISVPIVKNKFNLGAGAIVGTILGEKEAGFGILYGVATYGSPDNNVSLGIGSAYAGGEWAPSPILNLNGMFRISNRGYIITENYYYPMEGTDLVLFSAGGRWIIKRAALDFGLFIPIGTGLDRNFAFPWLGVTIPFGKN